MRGYGLASVCLIMGTVPKYFKTMSLGLKKKLIALLRYMQTNYVENCSSWCVWISCL